MPPLSAFLSNAVEKLLFRPVSVLESQIIGGRFQLVRVQGETLKGVRWTPGQAMQFYLGDLTKRAYTPIDMDATAGSARFLFYLHGGGPGSAWASMLKTGDMCHVMRPKESLDFTSVRGDAVFFGDETSFAAAQALQGCSGDDLRRRYVFEVTSKDASEKVAAKLGLDRAALIEREEDGSHLAAVAATLASYAASMRVPQWVFTGQARSIQALRGTLRAEGIELAHSKVRAYWSPGKKGMD
jgi:NADPH-dependent ferric siderophore reductase